MRFFDIAEVQQASILTEWLRWKDVGRLHSAVCNKQERSKFLSLFQSQECVFHSVDYPFLKSYENKVPSQEWILRQGGHLQAINLSGDILTDDQARRRVLQHFSSSVSAIRINLIKAGAEVNFRAKIQAVPKPSLDLTAILGDIQQFTPNIKIFHIFRSVVVESLVPLDDFQSLGAYISSSRSLRELEISSVIDMSIDLLHAICSAPTLSSVVLRSCTMSAIGRANVFTQTNPTVKSFRCTNCTGANAVAMFPNITKLNLEQLNAADIGLIAQHCKFVVTADLRINRGVLSLEIANIVADAWRCIQDLRIWGKGVILEDALAVIVTQCVSLNSLSCKQSGRSFPVEDVTIPADYTGSHLRKVEIQCISATTLSTILDACSYLHTLSSDLHRIRCSSVKVLMLHAYDIEDADLLHLDNAHITHLGLHRLTSITNGGVLALVQTLPCLDTLNLHGCYDMTYKLPLLLPPLAPLLRNLEFVTFRNCGCYGDSESDKLVSDMMHMLFPHINRCHVKC